MISPGDAPQSAPFPIALDFLESNLEAKAQEGFACPHCQKTMEWKLGEKTKTEIAAVLQQRGVHQRDFYCDKDDCPSVDVDQDGSRLISPFIRQISANKDGDITVRTVALDDFIQETGEARTKGREIEDLCAVYHVRFAAVQSDKAAIEASLANRTRQLGEIEEQLQLAQDMITATTGQRAALQKTLDEIKRIAGVKAGEALLGVITELAKAAKQLKEACDLGGITSGKLIENARAWREKQEEAGGRSSGKRGARK